MGGRSRSSSSTAQTTETTNLNLQDIDGVAVAGVDGSVSIETTDQGTVDAAREIAIAGIDSSLIGFQENIDLASDIVDAGREQTQAAFGLTRDITAQGLDFAEGLSMSSQSFASDLSSQFVDSTSDLAGQFIAAGESVIEEQQAFVSDAGSNLLAAIDRIQARESVNTDARLEGITRVVVIGAFGIGAVALFIAARK